MATVDPRTPCLIGVGRRTWHPGDVGEQGAPEPLAMWAEVAREAAADAGAPGALSGLDSLQVVYCQSWDYDDPVARLATELAADPGHRLYSGIGGSVPQVLVGRLAADIGAGRTDLGLVVGGEALATVRRVKKAGGRPAWSHRAAERRPFPFDVPFHPAEVSHSIFEAYLTFALFDSARRAHLWRGLDQHRRMVGELLAPMTQVAAADPAHAWFPVARTAPELVDAGPDNRMVAYPYTKLTVAIMDVDMAAALLVASHETAERLGVPAERRVYLRGWGYAEDPPYVAERPWLWRSPAMAAAARDALAGAGAGIDDVAHLDLYSCFASSVAFAADALGLPGDAAPAGDGRSLTVTGGLPYHGGPGSNYMTHAIAAMAERLRSDPGSLGLTSGVGMHMTKHAYGLWSTTPGPPPPPPPTGEAAGPGSTSGATVPIEAQARGTARVAAYTVIHGRDGAPAWAPLVCDLESGARCYARLEDPQALVRAEQEELVGQTVHLEEGDAGVNLARW